jgi:hypothetical protein
MQRELSVTVLVSQCQQASYVARIKERAVFHWWLDPSHVWNGGGAVAASK